jgi:hypothetical protein
MRYFVKQPLPPQAPVVHARPGAELCYQCDGRRVCWLCAGAGTFAEDVCGECRGDQWCITCSGAGELPEGTRGKRAAARVAPAGGPSSSDAVPAKGASGRKLAPLPPQEPVTDPGPEAELCYECDGKRVCWACGGAGVSEQRPCGWCAAERWCIVCRGKGVLPEGAHVRAKVLQGNASQSRPGDVAGKGALAEGAHVRAKVSQGNESQSRPGDVGFFREMGHDDSGAPSLVDSRGKRGPEHKDKVVAYLRAGRMRSFSPGYADDFFDPTKTAGTRSTRTDGTYAWPDYLAYYVERYDVALPKDFERFMKARSWRHRDNAPTGSK